MTVGDYFSVGAFSWSPIDASPPASSAVTQVNLNDGNTISTIAYAVPLYYKFNEESAGFHRNRNANCSVRRTVRK